MEVQDDLMDWFGDYLVEVVGLLVVGKLKLLVDDVLIEKIQCDDSELYLMLFK